MPPLPQSSDYPNFMNEDNLYSLDDEKLTYQGEGAELQEEYVIPSEDSADGEYVLEDEDDDDPVAWQGEQSRKSSNPSVAGLLFKVLANPVDGWKQVKRCKYSVEKIASGCFYPLLIIASLSEFMALFHETDSNFVDLLAPAVITFITFFFGYFTVLLFGGMILPKEARHVMHTYFGKEYAMLNMSTLTLFYIIFRLFPMAGPILAFLPLWTIYIACKGVKLFRVQKDKEAATSGILSFLIIGGPIFWNWVFSDLLEVI